MYERIKRKERQNKRKVTKGVKTKENEIRGKERLKVELNIKRE